MIFWFHTIPALFVALALVMTISGPAVAVPASPALHTLEQTDGTRFQARQWGDEWSHGWETVEGYTIVFDSVDGNWTYARLGSDGSLVPSLNVVGRDKAGDGMRKGIRPAGKRRGEGDKQGGRG